MVRHTSRILVSACLVGRPVRYDSGTRTASHPLLSDWQAQGLLVPLCPAVAAGLSTPRAPAEITSGADAEAVLAGDADILTVDGEVVTGAFLEGAQIALETAQAHGCGYALLTDGSPSCGSSFVYDGQFGGDRVPGQGVVAALLRAHGIKVFDENRMDALAAALDRAPIRGP